MRGQFRQNIDALSNNPDVTKQGNTVVVLIAGKDGAPPKLWSTGDEQTSTSLIRQFSDQFEGASG